MAPESMKRGGGSGEARRPTLTWPREIPIDGLIHASVRARFDTLQSRYRSPALRAFLDGVDNDWSRVQIEP